MTPTDRPRRPRPSLSRDGIVTAAIAVVERDGANTLTLRKLGAELGADHTAVLRHFSGKDEIILAMVNRLLEIAVEDFPAASSWRETLENLARRVRFAYRKHPNIASLASARSTRQPSELFIADVVLGALLDAGFDPDQAATIYRSLVDATLAISTFDAAFSALDPGVLAEEENAWNTEYTRVSAEHYPRLAEAAPHLSQLPAQDHFEVILALILDGLEGRLRDRPGSSPA